MKADPQQYLARMNRNLPSSMSMLGVSVVLILMVAIFTNRNIQMNEDAVTSLMAERGSTLIDLFESSMLSDLRMRSGLMVQQFIEDLASRDDIQFVALVLDNGEIIAHSNPARVGGRLILNGKPVHENVMAAYGKEDPEDRGATYAIMRVEGRMSFVVHRTLFNWRGVTNEVPEPLEAMPAPSGMYPRVASEMQLQSLHIFVGQDASLLQQMQVQNSRSAIYSGLIVLLTALVAIVTIRFIENGSDARRKQQIAENLANQMVDEVKRLEKEVRRREKLAAVGDLAAGVAHEIRNPLSSIKGYATYFSTRFPAGSEDREAAKVMVQEVDRLNRVISDLIGVSKPTDVNPQLTDLGRLAEDTIRLLSPDAGQRGVSLRLEAEPLLARVDPDRLRQALLNVCLNAVEAMDQGGKLSIKIRGVDDKAILEIEDNGPGIPPEILSRIFDPYFTTKNQGTGLGLAMVLKIVDAHDGSVKVHSEQGHGTTVLITLPLNISEAGASPISL